MEPDRENPWGRTMLGWSSSYWEKGDCGGTIDFDRLEVAVSKLPFEFLSPLTMNAK